MSTKKSLSCVTNSRAVFRRAPRMEKFGSRCGLRSYTRLCSLLVQNLRKGNAELLARLQEEADAAMELRKDTARKLGEEAGTKLLVPMIMMLIVVMMMITIPAYLGFAF